MRLSLGYGRHFIVRRARPSLMLRYAIRHVIDIADGR